jgi:hypothetical protein
MIRRGSDRKTRGGRGSFDGKGNSPLETRGSRDECSWESRPVAPGQIFVPVASSR